MMMDKWLAKFDIYKGTVVANCFRSQRCPNFSPKDVLSDVLSEFHLVRRNIVSIRQSVLT